MSVFRLPFWGRIGFSTPMSVRSARTLNRGVSKSTILGSHKGSVFTKDLSFTRYVAGLIAVNSKTLTGFNIRNDQIFDAKVQDRSWPFCGMW